MTSRRRPTLFALLTLMAGLLVPLAVASATSPAAATSAPKCGRWVQHTYTRSRPCLVVGSIKPVVRQDGNYLLHNRHAHQTVEATCAWDHSTTWTWSATASVKAEAGLLFEKVSAEVSAGVSHSTTDSTHLGFSFKIKPGRWAYCARGHVGFTVTGHTYVENCGNTGCDHTTSRGFTAHIPSSSFIDTGDGRNIDWSQYLPRA